MNENTIIEKVQEIFIDVLDKEDIKLKKETMLSDIEGLDSLALINIIVSISSEFGIRLQLEDAENLDSIQSIIDLIKDRSK